MALSPTRVAAHSLRVLPRKQLSRALGHVARVRAPDRLLEQAMRVYCAAFRVDLSEAEVPPEGFASFDAFFTRRLRPGVRPLDPDEDALLSPADGRIEGGGQVTPDARFQVKGAWYELAALLGDSALAQRFVGGTFCIIYLSPGDYHRVHAPVDGTVEAVRHIGGTLYPVNRIGEHIPQLFARNERVVVQQQSPRHGDVASVMVGAIGVGRIGLAFDDGVLTNNGHPAGLRMYGEQRPQLARGDELGVFHMGSSVVLFAGPRAGLRFAAQIGSTVRYGQAVARKSSP